MESRKRSAHQPEAPNTSDLFSLDDNLQPHENHPALAANEKIETSVLQLPGTDLWIQPEWVWKETPEPSCGRLLNFSLMGPWAKNPTMLFPDFAAMEIAR